MKTTFTKVRTMSFTVFFALISFVGTSEARASIKPSDTSICTFHMKTDHKGRLTKLIPAGTYRIIGKRTGRGFSSGNFQRLHASHHHKVWKTLARTEGGQRMTVNLKNNQDSLMLYFNESHQHSGACVLEGSLHGWI
jgi:outer membrane protein assembly factor BamB